MALDWMAWTLPTAVFFVTVAVALVILTWLELRYPTRLRRGWLPMATTRGDRFFICVLSAAFVHVAWLGFTELPLWWASGLSLLLAAGLMRWG